MASDMDFDFSELDKLSADLAEIPTNARKNMRTAMQVTSGKVRKAWQAKLEGSSSLPHLGRAITFEVTSDHSSTANLEAEIGPERGKSQASFSHLSEFGSVNNPGRGYGLKSLEENQEDFEYGLAKAIEDAQKGVGL